MVLAFSVLLIVGIATGQFFDIPRESWWIELTTSVTLAYIMLGVGLEFSEEGRTLKSYGRDIFVGTTAAFLPVILWFFYFSFLKEGWKPSVIAALSSAPTSAGILLSMMVAAGLSGTWMFKKARSLAVIDDLATLFLLSPIQLLFTGFKPQPFIAFGVVVSFLVMAFRFQNSLRWPIGGRWLVLYAAIAGVIIYFIKHKTGLHLDVLIPAFSFGAILHSLKSESNHGPSAESSNEGRGILSLDFAVKGTFMLFVGLSFPKVETGSMSWGMTAMHILALTVLSNVGKCFPVFGYRNEASMKERLALSVAMFPRGEVGAAVLLIAFGYGFTSSIFTLAMLSLALNLILTGAFIWIVIKLIGKKPSA